MKISPMPNPGAMSGAVPQIGPTASADARERAKAAFLGQGVIRPSETPVDPRLANQQVNVRRLQMKTNHSPDAHYREAMGMATPATAPAPQAAPQSANPNPNGTAEQPAVEETRPLSPQFAALAKRNRELQVRERQIAEREKTLESRASEPDGASFKTRLKSEPLRVLQEAGVTYSDLTDAILANGQTLDPQAVEDSIMNRVNGVLSEKEKASEQAVLAQMRREADSLAREGETYELVRETRSVPKVMELIERTFRESGEVLDVDEAMSLVEAELMKDSLRLANTGKIRSQFQPQQSAPVPQAPLQRQTRTLTNQDMGSQPMSRKQRALAAFFGTLNR